MGDSDVMITTNSLGDNSSNFTYSHGQLKYLAWETTTALLYIHSSKLVHGNICPETLRAVPLTKRVCLAGFNPVAHGEHLDAPRDAMFASNDFLQGGQVDYCHDMHLLAYTLIVLAGCSLPWSTAKIQEEVVQVRQQYKNISPADFVNKYSQYLDPILSEWLKQALSLQPGADIEYRSFWDYLWNSS